MLIFDFSLCYLSAILYADIYKFIWKRVICGK